MAYAVHNHAMSLDSPVDINFDVSGYTLGGGMTAHLRINKEGSPQYFRKDLTLNTGTGNVSGAIAHNEATDSPGTIAYNLLGVGRHAYAINILGGLGQTLIRIQGRYTISPLTGAADAMSSLIETLTVTVDAHSRITNVVVGATPPDTSDNVTNTTGSTVAEQLAVYSDTTGKVIKTAGVTFPTTTPAKGQLLVPSSSSALQLLALTEDFGGRYSVPVVPETVTIASADTWQEYVPGSIATSGLKNVTYTGGRFTIDYTSAPPANTLNATFSAMALVGTTVEGRSIDIAPGLNGSIISGVAQRYQGIDSDTEDAAHLKYPITLVVPDLEDLDEADYLSLFIRSDATGALTIEKMSVCVHGTVDLRSLLLS